MQLSNLPDFICIFTTYKLKKRDIFIFFNTKKSYISGQFEEWHL